MSILERYTNKSNAHLLSRDEQIKRSFEDYVITVVHKRETTDNWTYAVGKQLSDKELAEIKQIFDDEGVVMHYRPNGDLSYIFVYAVSIRARLNQLAMIETSTNGYIVYLQDTVDGGVTPLCTFASTNVDIHTFRNTLDKLLKDLITDRGLDCDHGFDLNQAFSRTPTGTLNLSELLYVDVVKVYDPKTKGCDW